MKEYNVYLASVFLTSVVGSFILWLIFSLIPGSNTGLSLWLLSSIVIVSLVVLLCTLVPLYVIFKPFFLFLFNVNTYKLVAVSVIIGSALCFIVYYTFLGIAGNAEVSQKYFESGAYVVHLLIGGVYGFAFGACLSKMRTLRN